MYSSGGFSLKISSDNALVLASTNCRGGAPSLTVEFRSGPSIPPNAKTPPVTPTVIDPNSFRWNTVVHEKVLEVHDRLRGWHCAN